MKSPIEQLDNNQFANQLRKLDWYYSYSITADYTITDVDKIKTVLVTTATSNLTVTLPTAADNLYRVIEVIKVDSGAGTVTVDGEGSETINGYASLICNYQYSGVLVKCNGTGWEILNLIGDHSIEYKSTSAIAITTPSASTWYQPTSHELSVPPGKWLLGYQMSGLVSSNNAGNTYHAFWSALSITAAAPFTPLTDYGQFSRTGPSTVSSPCFSHCKNYIVTVSSTTVYKLIIQGIISAGTMSLQTLGDLATTIIRATRIS